jgi:hypothetical protein
MYYRCQYLLVQQVLKDIAGIDIDLMHHDLDFVIRYTPSLGLLTS